MGGCPALPETMCGAPEVVDAGSTGSIDFKPFRFHQNFVTECNDEEAKEFRTADGTCNHVFNLGSAETPLRRLIPPVYDDKMGAPRTRGKDGYPLPLPTDVSRTLHQDSDTFNGFSLMFMQWGQFIDHDVALSPVPTETNKALRCCGPDGSLPQRQESSDCFPIIMADGDNRFRGKCMEFARSIGAMTPSGEYMTPREQVNSVTAFLDGSMIYGSFEERQKELRESTSSGPGAMMKMQGELLPPSKEGSCVHRPGQYCFLAGDTRVNEQPGLIVIHTMWVRLHNNIARKLRPFRPRDTEEQLFQVTRKIVVAILQHVHYREWLPRVVGYGNMRAYNLWPWKRVGYSGFVDPRITNAFSTAAFRFGHSMIPRQFNISGRVFLLRELFNRPDAVFDDFNGVLTSLFSPTQEMQAQTVDRKIVSELTGHLFEPVDQRRNAPSRGLDLVALNIQRGRDHGLPPFNKYREYCGFEPFTRFEDFGTDVAQQLASLYKHVDDVDLFTGGLLEATEPSAVLGPTFACIISQQFNALKHGDRFFYETDRFPEGFTDAQLDSIRKMTLAHLCCQMNGVSSVQRDVLLAPSPGNPSVKCSDLQKNFLDLSLWRVDTSSRRTSFF